MWPLIRSGDIVHIAPGKEYEPGDIVLVERGQSWLLHRLLRIEENGGERQLILKGDAFSIEDAPVSSSQVLGSAYVIEHGSRVIHFDTPYYKLLTALVSLPIWQRLLPLFDYRVFRRTKRALRHFGRYFSLKR